MKLRHSKDSHAEQQPQLLAQLTHERETWQQLQSQLAAMHADHLAANLRAEEANRQLSETREELQKLQEAVGALCSVGFAAIAPVKRDSATS